MAHWTRRTDTGQVRIWTRNSKNVPRKLYRHLDGQEDFVVRAWVSNYELQYEGKQFTPDHLLTGDLRAQLEQYLTFLQTHKEHDEKTWKQYDTNLRRHVLPYFLDRETPLRNPQDWPAVSIKLVDYLVEKGLKAGHIKRCNINLLGFWEWLRDEGIVHTELRLRRPVVGSLATPLKVLATPDEILARAMMLPPHLRFIALAGYFLSLRSQEIFGLRIEDFRAGSLVAQLECTKATKRVGLYDKLAVSIQRQRSTHGRIRSLKTHASKAWVACFNEHAARELVALARKFEAGEIKVPATTPKGDPVVISSPGNWFHRSYSWYTREWDKHGIPGLSLKDLRRASLYWLGHHTEMYPLELMKHARHSQIKTTMLYLRRPEEKVEIKGDPLDLDN